MDEEYPAQSGVYEKQSNIAFPGWLPEENYFIVNPRDGAAGIGLLAEEQPPTPHQLLPQAIKAFLPMGGTKLHYLISLRQRVLGDDLATCHGPMGIPSEGILIERVVEDGDPNNRNQRVTVIGKGGIAIHSGKVLKCMS
jgi:hypothetical protein